MVSVTETLTARTEVMNSIAFIIANQISFSAKTIAVF